MGSHSFNQVVGYGNLEELSNKLLTFSYRVTKEEALDLPERIHHSAGDVDERTVEHYHSLKKAIAILDSGEPVSAPAAITQLIRLQQLLCGHLVTDDGELVEVLSYRSMRYWTASRRWMARS